MKNEFGQKLYYKMPIIELRGAVDYANQSFGNCRLIRGTANILGCTIQQRANNSNAVLDRDEEILVNYNYARSSSIVRFTGKICIAYNSF